MRIVNLTGANQGITAPVGPFLYYRGFSVRETSGAATALVRVWDSTVALGATGTVLDEISLLASESARENYGVAKVAKIGIYIQVVSGAVAGDICFD